MPLSIKDFLFESPDEREGRTSIDRQMILGLLRGAMPAWGGTEDMPSPPLSGYPDIYGPQDLTPRQQREPENFISPIQYLQAPQGQTLMDDLAQRQQPGPSFDWAIKEAKRRYPRIADLPLTLTYNASRERNSETYPPDEKGNPRPGKWTVDMGRAPYASRPELWPELVGLEALHGLQDTDPTYQKLTNQVIKSYSPDQMKAARATFEKYRDAGDVPDDFQRYLRKVHVQEFIRGRLWGKMFKDVEHPDRPGPSTVWNYSPQQINLLDSIQSYLQSGSDAD